MSAPAPSSTTSVFNAMVHFASGNPARVPGRLMLPGITLKKSRSAVIVAANTPATSSDFDFAEPSPPSLYSDFRVSAVAVPVGKGRASLFTSWRLMGMATKTPWAAMTANQAMSGSVSGRSVVTMSSAPKAAMLPPPVMKPAPEATVVRALFSSAPIGRAPTAARPLNTPKAMMQAVSVTPRDQPVLKNTYRFDKHITAPTSMPLTTARTVSCAPFLGGT